MSKKYIIAVILAVTALAAYFAWQRVAGSRPAVPASIEFGSVNDFLASDAWKSVERPKTVFIGIDGASWKFLDPLLDAGELPNLARLKREGAYGTLRSVSCYVSPPAWVTMFTGALPAKTGVYTFAKWDRSNHEFDSVNSQDVRVHSVWDIASYAGRRVAVANVPMTYPVRPVNGIMVSGLMTPVETNRISIESQKPPPGVEIPVDGNIETYGDVLRSSFGNSLNLFLCAFYDTQDDGRREFDTATVSVLTRGGPGGRGVMSPPVQCHLGEYSSWLHVKATRDGRVDDAWCKFRFERSETSPVSVKISPIFYSITVPYVYPPDLDQLLHSKFNYYLPTRILSKALVPSLTEDGRRYLSFFYDQDDWDLLAFVFTQSDNIHHTAGFVPLAVDVYKTIDRAIGDMIQKLPKGSRLVIASDHGFDTYRYGIDLNQLLAKLGLLRWESKGHIDYDHTLVFHNLWHLYFNQALLTADELTRRGIDVPAGSDPAGALLEYLRRTARVPMVDGKGEIALELTEVGGGEVGDHPDAVVRGTYGEYVIDFWGLREPKDVMVRELTGGDQFDHTREGIVLLWGDGVRSGYDLGEVGIEDVAPTLCYLMRLPISRDMDGHVIGEAFDAAELAARSRFYVDDYLRVPLQHADVDPQDEELEKKLRSLGYIR